MWNDLTPDFILSITMSKRIVFGADVLNLNSFMDRFCLFHTDTSYLIEVHVMMLFCY